MLIRQAWQWLERRHEPLMVGAAVALMGLAYLLPPVMESASGAKSPQFGQTHSTAEDRRRSLALPADDEFYRVQWAEDAKLFYAQQIFRQPTDASAEAKNASLAKTAADRKSAPVEKVMPVAAVVAFLDDQQPASQVAHAHGATAQVASGASTTTAPDSKTVSAGVEVTGTEAAWAPTISPRMKRWRVATCLAAGLLASILFATVWPLASGSERPSRARIVQADRTQTVGAAPSICDPIRGEAITIRLPAVWVGVRPTVSQTLRRSVLVASYVIAGVGGWGMLG